MVDVPVFVVASNIVAIVVYQKTRPHISYILRLTNDISLFVLLHVVIWQWHHYNKIMHEVTAAILGISES